MSGPAYAAAGVGWPFTSAAGAGLLGCAIRAASSIGDGLLLRGLGLGLPRLAVQPLGLQLGPLVRRGLVPLGLLHPGLGLQRRLLLLPQPLRRRRQGLRGLLVALGLGVRGGPVVFLPGL